MLNIRSARKTAINNNVRLIDWSDHSLNSFISKFKLELVKHENQIAHWINKDQSKELVILYDDKNITHKSYIADNY